MQRHNKNLSMIALSAGVLIALTQSAFTSARPKQISGTEYQFNGTQTSQMKSASEYSVVSGSGPSCDDSNVLPCTINVSGSLQTWLNAHTDAQILSAADQTKD